MSVSLKNLPKINTLMEKNSITIKKPLKREQSTGKSKSHLNIKCLFYKNNEKKIINTDLYILNFITNDNDRKYSFKTSLSDSFPNLYNYELYMINKYDECLNKSLSFIQKFDLEEEENKLNNSFSSCENNDSDIEQIEIIKKTSNNKIIHEIDDDNNVKLEKEWNDIKKYLLNKNQSKY